MAITRLGGANAITGTLPAANINDTSIGNITALPAGVGGNLIKLASVSTDNTASSISFDGYFTSDYTNYIAYYNDIKSSSTASTAYIRVRVSDADVTASDYRFVSSFQSRSSSANNFVTNQGAWDTDLGARITSDTLGNAEAEKGHAIINIFNPLDTTGDKRIISEMVYMRAANTEIIRSKVHMEYDNASALSGLTIYIDSGNISADLTLYGVKN